MSTDRLSSTFFVAVLFHGIVILGVTFTVSPLGDSDLIPTLRVTLVQETADAEAVPEEDVYLAQRTNVGAGGATPGDRPTTTLSADHLITQEGDQRGADLFDTTPREPVPSADRLVTRADSATQIDALPDPTEDPADEAQTAANLLAREAEQTLASEIDLQAQNPETDRFEGPSGPSTREAMLATYLDGWRRRVERIGTINFPDEARNQGFSNNPTVEVTIDADGRLEAIIVRESSGNSALDQAALTILRSAAPFEPLPDSVRAEYGLLRFAYEWDFGAELASEQP
ncbi:MAG: energy transducer TonB [Gammaproteobacteria bacterium]|nr:energy transducer TonB [Gammaproteobacteria bacterium]